MGASIMLFHLGSFQLFHCQGRPVGLVRLRSIGEHCRETVGCSGGTDNSGCLDSKTHVGGCRKVDLERL